MKKWYMFLFAGFWLVMQGCNRKAPGQQEEEKAADPFREEQSADHQWEANQYFARLMDAFRNASGGDRESYPDWYGGSYIDNQGQLVVLVTGDTLAAGKNITEITGGTNIRLEPVTSSRERLMEIMERIGNFFDWHPEEDLTKIIAGWSVNDYTNKVEVYLIKDEPGLREEFRKKIIDSPVIRFVQSGQVAKISGGGGTGNCVECGIEMQTLQPVYYLSDEEVEIEISNKREDRIDIGDAFIEYYNGTGWDRIGIDGFAKFQVLYFVPAGDKQRFSIPLHPELYAYTPGKYRVFKTLNDPLHNTSYDLTAEFRMEPDPPVNLAVTPAAYPYPVEEITVTLTNNFPEKIKVIPEYEIEYSDFKSWKPVESGMLSKTSVEILPESGRQFTILLNENNLYASGYSYGIFRIKIKVVAPGGQMYTLKSSFWIRYT